MTPSDLPILSLLIWTPIAGGVLALLLGEGRALAVKYLALAFAVLTFLLSMLLYKQFDNAVAGMQFMEEAVWIGAFNINYHLGVDGIALPLILLTGFTTILVVLAAWQVIQDRSAAYMAAFLILKISMATSRALQMPQRNVRSADRASVRQTL